MVDRRKTWSGIGFFALAGSSLAAAGPANALPAGNATALAGHHAGATTPADEILRGAIFLAAEGGEQGGEAGEGGENGDEAGGEAGGEAAGGGEGGGVSAPEAGYSLNSIDPNDYKYEAGAEIAAYAAGVHASYAASIVEAKKMQAAVKAFLAAPSEETLAAARKAWVAARPTYLVTEAYRFYDGPIEELEGQINAWPLNEAFIDYVEGDPDAGVVNDKSALSIKEIVAKNQVTDENDVTTGWHAIEFLLWGQDLDPNGPGARPATDYIADKGNNDRRREYLELVSDQLVEDLETVDSHWRPGGDYLAKFTAMPPREAIGRVVNGLAVLAGSELMSERMAVGLDSGSQEDEHSCFSDTTHQDFIFDVKGIEDVWTGKYNGYAGPGLGGLVAGLDADLAKKIDGLIADTTAKVAALHDPWDQVLASPQGSPERQKAEDAVAALQALGEGFAQAGRKLGVLVQIPSE